MVWLYKAEVEEDNGLIGYFDHWGKLHNGGGDGDSLSMLICVNVFHYPWERLCTCNTCKNLNKQALLNHFSHMLEVLEGNWE